MHSSPARPKSTAVGGSTCALTTRRWRSTRWPARSSSSPSTPDGSTGSATTSSSSPPVAGRSGPTCQASTCRSSTACSRSTTPRRCLRSPMPGAAGSSSSAVVTSAWRWPRPTSSGDARRRSSRDRRSHSRTVDIDFGERVADAMRSHGVDVRCGVGVEGFEPGTVSTTDGPVVADLVVLGIGVEARSDLAAAAGPSSARNRRSSSTSVRPRRSTLSGRPVTAPPSRTR